jgi:CheY-like chemotaxis protein
MPRERRILLVESDQATADEYLAELRRDGIPVEHVRTARQADDFVRSRQPALVVIDTRLPDQDGRTVVENWASDPQVGAIPVWILTQDGAQDGAWWHSAASVQRYFPRSRVPPARLGLEIRATLGLPYSDRLVKR